MKPKLSSFVKVNRQFMRSIRLDADIGREDAIHGYILQSSAQNALDTISTHIQNSKQRAFTWTGPYGGGKSSLALALATLAGGDEETRCLARSTLGVKDKTPIQEVFCSKLPWKIIPVIGSRSMIIDEIGDAIDEKDSKENIKKYQGKKSRNVIKELLIMAEDASNYEGVLLIIDELGKFLEHAAYTGDDVGFYQDLAEAASRSKGNLVVIGILHQSFEQYASRLGQSAQKEWAKIQGRYVDIPLVAASDETVALIGRALSVDFDHEVFSIKISEKVAKVIGKRRPGAAADVRNLLDACWPLHPVTAALLGPASRKRFGQNERSVFSFLASAEPLGFSEILAGLDASASSYYWPHQFWDYLRVNFEPSILASSDSHKWAVCAEAIERTEAKFSQLHVDLVKTTGLIEMMGNGSGLASEFELLKVSVNALDSKLIENALNDLAMASILIFRKHLNAYGVYAGSDFDIESAVRDAKIISHTDDYSKIVDSVDLGPITARRHYWNTGAMRWFSRNLISDANASAYVSKFRPAGSQCGEFLLVLGIEESKNDFSGKNHKITKLAELAISRGLVVGSPNNSDRIEDLILELAALDFVKNNNRKLEGDDVAMREITARTQATKSMLSNEMRDAFHDATWYSKSEENSHKHLKRQGLSHLASDVADTIYTSSPTVHSELINRDSLSSNAAKAQRELLHTMLNKSNEAYLGYNSFSADAGLYYTVVRALGFHREEKGEWKMLSPAGTKRSDSMRDVWKATEKLIFESTELITLNKIYEIWRLPPLGVKAGLMPIFALAFFMANRYRLALYIEGMFTPEVTTANLDEWLQDPKRIQWRHVQIEATEKIMLEELSSALTDRMGYKVTSDSLDSARALVAMVFKLSPWARRTSLVSQQAQTVRQVLLKASDPYKVLFADLPLILGTINPYELAKKTAQICGELNECYTKRLHQVANQLHLALDHNEAAESLNNRANIVVGIGAEFKIEAFCGRLVEYQGMASDIEGLLMLAIDKPAKDWTDNDINAGEIKLLSWSLEFRRLETMAAVRGRPANRRAIGVVFGVGRTVTASFDVSENDSAAISMLTNDLLSRVTSGKIKREVILAAIAEVGATLAQEISE